MEKITVSTKYMTAGIGTGIIIPYLLKKYVDPGAQPPIAGWPWSWVVPLVTGPLSLILLYMGKVKKTTMKDFLRAYGISTTIFGLMNVIDASYEFMQYQQTKGKLTSYSRGLQMRAQNRVNVNNLPVSCQASVRYPYLYAPKTDMWSVKATGFGSTPNGAYAKTQTGFSNKTIIS